MIMESSGAPPAAFVPPTESGAVDDPEKARPE